jgi:hypothetical protein
MKKNKDEIPTCPYRPDLQNGSPIIYNPSEHIKHQGGILSKITNILNFIIEPT